MLLSSQTTQVTVASPPLRFGTPVRNKIVEEYPLTMPDPQPVPSAASIDALVGSFHDGTLPLPARLDAARSIVQLLTDAIATQRAEVADLVQRTPLDDDTLATLYWDFEDLVPSSMLGQFHEIREIVEPRCPWMYPCPECGKEQPVTSRSALKSLQRALDPSARRPPPVPACPACVEARNAERIESHRLASHRHRERVRQLRTMPYKEYLLTPEWQERRKARLRAARYRCQVCNARDRVLNVHHRTYERRGEEFARDLIVLCQPCHYLFHENGSLAPHGDEPPADRSEAYQRGWQAGHARYGVNPTPGPRGNGQAHES